MKSPFETKKLLSQYQAVSAIRAATVNAIENDCPYAWAEFVEMALYSTDWRPEFANLSKAAWIIIDGEIVNILTLLESAKLYSDELLAKWIGEFDPEGI